MSNLFLKLRRRLLLYETGIHISRLNKADYSSFCEWVSSNQLKANKRFFSPLSKKEFFLTDSLWPRTLAFVNLGMLTETLALSERLPGSLQARTYTFFLGGGVSRLLLFA